MDAPEPIEAPEARDPIAAFHRLEDLLDRKNVDGEPAAIVKTLRGRVSTLRSAPPAEWMRFYRDAIRAARSLEAPDRAPSGRALNPAERRYLEALLADIRDAPNGVFELWSRRLQDQRDELWTKAKEEATRLELKQKLTNDRLTLRLSSTDRSRWADWLDHYLELWSSRVVNEVPHAIVKAQNDCLAKAPPELATHVAALPATPEEAFSPTNDADWSGLSADGPVAGAWSLFGRSIRGGIFAVMAIATVSGSIAAALQSSTRSPLRGLVVLLLLIPVIIWARISSQNQRKAAIDTLTKQLDERVRQRLLQVTQTRIDARLRSLRGWLQRTTRAARTDAQAWLRSGQLQIAESSERTSDTRANAAVAEIIRDFEDRVGELTDAL